MKLAQMLGVCAASLLPLAVMPTAMAQKWEFGGAAGGGYYTSQDVTNSGGSASAKFQTNVIGSVWLEDNITERWGGELRYDYQRGAAQLNSGGTQTSFDADSHNMHYDFQWHAAPSEAKVRPFVAFGAGVKVFHGTGAEAAYQPLEQYAVLSRVKDIQPVISVGAGVKWHISPHLLFRLELHDYMTPFPTKVIAPNTGTGSKVSGWLFDFVPEAGLSYLF